MKTVVAGLTLVFYVLLLPVFAVAQNIIWSENFETGIGNWYASNGVWEVGTPIGGPGSGHGSINCGATDLDGFYPNGANSGLISPVINLPNISGTERIRVRFWHWFSIENGYDQGVVRILPVGGSWQTVSETEVDGYSGAWTCCSVDITAFAGTSVKISFYFTSDNSGNSDGWYVDDINVVLGTEVFLNPENFESGIGDWSVDNGLWELGAPTVGPVGAHNSINCFGTVLNGNYAGSANTRLISPRITLPSIQNGERIRLRYWQWFSIENGYDQGVVQISVDGGVWTTVSESEIDGSGIVWTNSSVDLTQYSGSNVRVGFYLTTDNSNVSTGWYIDDVSIIVGEESCPNPEDFESGIGDWSVDNGLWELGKPVSGPFAAHSDTNCFATVLGGNYADAANTRLISPRLFVPSGFGQFPGMFFWQWFQIENGYDNGYVQVATEHGLWTTVAGPYTGNASQWTQAFVDFSPFVDSIIRVAFYFTSDNTNTGQGWYVDDIRFEGVITDLDDTSIAEPIPFTLFPNPFCDKLHIMSNVQSKLPFLVEVLDIYGRRHVAQSFEMLNHELNTWTINTSALPSGVYFVKVLNMNSSFSTTCIKL